MPAMLSRSHSEAVNHRVGLFVWVPGQMRVLYTEVRD